MMRYLIMIFASFLTAFCSPSDEKVKKDGDAHFDSAALTLTPVGTSGVQKWTWTYRSVDDGVSYDISGFLLKPAGNGPFPAVVISHGKGGSANDMVGANIGPKMVEWGLVCIGVNYTHAREERAAGSPGSGDVRTDMGANQANILRAGKCLQVLRSLGYVDKARIGAYGHSMGAFMTGALAGIFPDSFIVAAHTAGGTAAQGAKDWDICTKASHIAGIKIPYLLHHGEQDAVVPYEHGQAMYLALKNKGVVTDFIGYPALDHGNIPANPDVLAATKAWFQTHGLMP